jgi:crotonobetainyl-CoA:carnitine CoA-transferase CaiB-like acyl-CoA transferase
MPSLYYHPAQAGDGRWLQFGNLLPHLFDNFLRVTDLLDALIDPDFDPAQMLFRNPEAHEAFRTRMLQRIQERPAAGWMADFVADGGVVAGPYQTTQEALADPDIVANGHVVARADGGVQLGPLARLERTPAQPGADAHNHGAALADRWSASPRPRPAGPGSDALPLAGVRVVEIATIIAAPMAASCLADMGADVVKVEQIGGDPYRGLLSGLGSARVNAGKRSISVDLKSPAGREIVLALVRDADVLIHNYRPGVPERLGIGYEALSKLNPRLIYLQANGYGPDGPGALRPSTHPIPGAAMGGVLYQLGERVPQTPLPIDEVRTWTRRIMAANEVNPDPNTAVVIATSVLLGLAARQRTRAGQRVSVDMFGANAWANHDDFCGIRASRQGRCPMPGCTVCPPPTGCIPAPGNSGCSSRWSRRAIGSASSLCWPARGCQRRRSLCSKPAATRPWTYCRHCLRSQSADQWEELLGGAGLGCVRADGPAPADVLAGAPAVRRPRASLRRSAIRAGATTAVTADWCWSTRAISRWRRRRWQASTITRCWASSVTTLL